MEGVFEVNEIKEINRCEHIEILNELIVKNIRRRKLVIWNFERNEKAKKDLKKYLDDTKYDIAFWFDSFEISNLKVKDFLSKKSEKLYVLVWGSFRADVEKILNECQFQEVEDYIYRTHKPVKVSGNIKKYRDKYGNEISHIPDNLVITLLGYGSKIDIASNVIFGLNSRLSISSKSRVCIEENAKFETDIVISITDFSICLLGGSYYCKNTNIFCREGILKNNFSESQ